jgi:hypothetical protein
MLALIPKAGSWFAPSALGVGDGFSFHSRNDFHQFALTRIAVG